MIFLGNISRTGGDGFAVCGPMDSDCGAATEIPQTLPLASGSHDCTSEVPGSTELHADQGPQHIPTQEALQVDLRNGGNADPDPTQHALATQVQPPQGQWTSQTAVLVHSDLVSSRDPGAVPIGTIVPQEHAMQGHLVLAQYVMPASANQVDELVNRDTSYLSLGGAFPTGQTQWSGQLVAETGIKNPLPDAALLSASALMLQDQLTQASQKALKCPLEMKDGQNAKGLSAHPSPSQDQSPLQGAVKVISSAICSLSSAVLFIRCIFSGSIISNSRLPSCHEPRSARSQWLY
jgi:hypothetical protein